MDASGSSSSGSASGGRSRGGVKVRRRLGRVSSSRAGRRRSAAKHGADAKTPMRRRARRSTSRRSRTSAAHTEEKTMWAGEKKSARRVSHRSRAGKSAGSKPRQRRRVGGAKRSAAHIKHDVADKLADGGAQADEPKMTKTKGGRRRGASASANGNRQAPAGVRRSPRASARKPIGFYAESD